MKLFMLVYGRSKTGKSFLTNTAPGPRLILDAEGGSRFLPGKKVEWNFEGGDECPSVKDGENISVIVYVRSYKTIEGIYEFLDEGNHLFNSVILDSISEIQQRCIDDQVGVNQLKLQDWGDILRRLTAKIREFRDLTFHHRRSVNVFAIAMAKENQEVNGEIRVVPLMQGRVSDSLPYYFDIVTYLYLVDSEDGDRVRVLQCGSNPKLETGDRTGMLPEGIENPTIEKIMSYINGGIDGTSQGDK